MPTEIPALGPRPIVEPNDPPSDVVLTSSTPAPCTPTATKLRKDATPLRKSPTPHLRPDRKPPLTANAARELGRRNGSRWAALGSNGGADWARARSFGDAIERGRAEAQMQDAYANAVANDGDALKNMGF